MLGAFTVNMEVVGTCNLACPACAVGNHLGPAQKLGSIGGTMPVDRFQACLDKLAAELPYEPADVMIALYSWGEPLIHPKIGELVERVHDKGFKAAVSSNLNYDRNLEAVARSRPDTFVVSLSGFSQGTYAKTHRGGDIENVKANMRRLSALMRAEDLPLEVYVVYHVYRHNGLDELDAMAEFADSLGFSIMPIWASLLPVENIVRHAKGESPLAEPETIENLVVPLDQAIEIASANRPEPDSCKLLTQQLDIDVDGRVKLCCSSFSRDHLPPTHFLQETLATIQERRNRAPLCGDCMACGAHRIMIQGDYASFQAIANEKLGRDEARGLISQQSVGTPGLKVESGLLHALNLALVANDREAFFKERARLLDCLRAKYPYDVTDPALLLADYRARAAWKRGFHGPRDPLRLLFALAEGARRFEGRLESARETATIGAELCEAWSPGDEGYRSAVERLSGRFKDLAANCEAA